MRFILFLFDVVGLSQKRRYNLGQDILSFGLRIVGKANRINETIQKLREIEPDLSRQELSETKDFNLFYELKRRTLQAVQIRFLEKVVREFFPESRHLLIVDIGDSAGTHMKYIKTMLNNDFDIDTVSVNLDPDAIKKIAARGQKAVLSRAEDFDPGDSRIDLFTSFEMVEHLHDPALFFRRLAKKGKSDYFLISVPYLKRSRVGLHSIRSRYEGAVNAEMEHIFELSPEDWKLILLHGGWKAIKEEVYYQYPRKIPLYSLLLKLFWKRTDYEGFWLVLLKRDLTYSDRYSDWDEQESSSRV